MNNNYWAQGNMNAGVGFGNQQPAKIVMNQMLSTDEVNELRVEGPKFNTKLTRKEYLRAICSHKNPNNGNIDLHANGDGTHTCNICQATFTILNPDKVRMETVEDICADFHDLFQTIKLMYGPIPIEAGREFYAMTGFIQKIPEMYRIANEYFSRIQNAGYGVEENRGVYGINMLNAIFNPNAAVYPAGGAMMGSPIYGVNYVAPNAGMGGTMDPNYQAWLAAQQGNNNIVVNSHNPNQQQQGQQVAHPAQQATYGNAIGFVEDTQQVAAPGIPNVNVQATFKG